MIMECLWKEEKPLSCGEIHQSCNKISESAIYISLCNLKEKKAIKAVEPRKNKECSNRKPTQLYIPIFSNVDYMETLLKNTPLFSKNILPKVLRKFIDEPNSDTLITELEDMIAQARGRDK